MPGKFITFEGGEGSGKTTIAKLIKDYFEKEGYNVILTREPGGVDIAEKIRNLILDVNNTNMDYRTEALLYAAARRQHLVEKVIPAILDNKIVICDRFIDSSLVYQGIARGIGIDEVYNMNLFAIDELMPSLTIFFDVNPKTGLNRVHSNEREVNRLDLESLEFHNMVYNGYLLICDKYHERVKKVDASNTVEQVFNDVLNLIKEEL